MIASVRVRQLVAFLSGFLLFLAINRIILYTHSSASQARFDQITPKLGEGDAVLAEETRKKIRLFTFILTNSKNAAKKAPYIKSTWTRRVERFLFLSNEDNSSLPAIKTVVEDNKETHFQKVITGLLFAYRQNLAYFDYYIKAEDDTYVIPENLRFLLRAFDPDDLIMMGHVFQPNYTQTDKSDRAAYVLSRGALLAVAAGASKNLSDCRGSTLPEHVAMAVACLYDLEPFAVKHMTHLEGMDCSLRPKTAIFSSCLLHNRIAIVMCVILIPSDVRNPVKVSAAVRLPQKKTRECERILVGLEKLPEVVDFIFLGRCSAAVTFPSSIEHVYADLPVS
ncbi:unnamed protein product [Dibothriocephalus latus]|uniref:N-acetylgalactosaminide beta-1,3-galactosyltransferase n=1 Tax=Dibothriocephalus latus TaxID=60516 RepID=A0A3P7NUV9_DIBLA|nr:unnamed protein product [Dibothriocephalus latus]